jgi:hypothetical protein
LFWVLLNPPQINPPIEESANFNSIPLSIKTLLNAEKIKIKKMISRIFIAKSKLIKTKKMLETGKDFSFLGRRPMKFHFPSSPTTEAKKNETVHSEYDAFNDKIRHTIISEIEKETQEAKTEYDAYKKTIHSIPLDWFLDPTSFTPENLPDNLKEKFITTLKVKVIDEVVCHDINTWIDTENTFTQTQKQMEKKRLARQQALKKAVNEEPETIID